MIEIGLNAIAKNYGFKQILCGADLEIMTRERVAIVGRNGSGKTTLFRMIAGLETPDTGSVSIRKGASVGYLEQIPQLTEWDDTTYSVLTQPFAEIVQTEARLRALEAEMATETVPTRLDELMAKYAGEQDTYFSLGGYEMQERTEKIINGFRIRDLLEQPFRTLSGGQKTIVKLAAVILGHPDVLLLDEPTNHLDLRTLHWFEEYLRAYRGTVVIVSHDRYFLDRVATKTILLEKGFCTTFLGNYSFALKEQERLVLLEFEQYKNQRKQIDAMKAAIQRFRDWGAQSDNEKFYKKAIMLERRLEKMEKIERPIMEKPTVPVRFSGNRAGKEVLRLEDFSLTLGNTALFCGAQLLVVEREKLCLMGDNGCGKSSLIRALLGECTEYSGTLAVGSGVQIGYIPQEIRFEHTSETVLDAFQRDYPCSRAKAREILAKYFFRSDQVFKRVSGLSGGEKVLLKLAALMQNRINLLILDEPTNHIDIETREMLEQALADYSGTLLFVSHDRFFIRRIANRVVFIANKHIQPAELPG